MFKNWVAIAHLAEQEACELRTRPFTAGANHQTDKCSFWVAQPYPHSQREQNENGESDISICGKEWSRSIWK